MTPVNVNESDQWHLLLITQSGLRIYLQFEEEEVQLDQDEGIVFNYIHTKRFTKSFWIAEIMNLPD
jgi:hypothetical protein